ncbi:MAG: 23S rRNA (adenine(2030)-N(6))-methyltransferase RlmJ [Chitinophagales bacterium]|nr:23S rRNA (adenine(2030)-N(6))-methyltransferase RlmJ [Hyphomicrobiales bacterium]
MNYRHIYHAGNFADVLKHIVLTLCLDYLKKKDGPLCILDAHAGAGVYDLHSAEAAKTGEWEKGIGRLHSAGEAVGDLEIYLGLIRAWLENGRYPGSPLLMANSLRPQDRLIANELHPLAFEALTAAIEPFASAGATNTDAYECIRAHIPPRERRGLVLIDPPFEKKDEFETLSRQMTQWKKRWPGGVYLLWYPIKAHLPIEALKSAARALGLPRTWFVEALILPRNQPDTLNGCGLLVFNAPFTIPEKVAGVLPYLRQALDLHATASGWITPPE